MTWIRRIATVIAAMMMTSMLATSTASADEPLINTSLPAVTGVPTFGKTLAAAPGTWNPDDVIIGYQWLRNRAPIAKATTSIHVLALADVGTRIAVRITAFRSGSEPVVIDSAATEKVSPAAIVNKKLPKISGTLKFRKTLTTSGGTWPVSSPKLTYRWYRNGVAIAGSAAAKKSYKLGPSDVAKRMTVRVTVAKPGYIAKSARSAATGVVQHLKPVKRTVKYRVVTRGKITTSLATFRAQAQATLNDPRGWRGMGVSFKEVKSGGSMTLVLSQASKVPSYSSGCSRTYSCRVGRYVIINQDRWKKATPSWNKAKGSLRNYRHMVVNHETGHWLGHGHRSCGSKGSLAPLMQQQSKGLHGCKINPWPKASELY